MYLFDLKTAEPALLFCTGERSCRQVVTSDARSLPGLLPCAPHRVRSRFGVLSLPARSDRLSLQEISPPARYFLHWVPEENGVKSVICKGNLLSETFVRLRALIDCGRHKGRRSVFHVQNLCSCLLIVPGTGRQARWPAAREVPPVPRCRVRLSILPKRRRRASKPR